MKTQLIHIEQTEPLNDYRLFYLSKMIKRFLEIYGFYWHVGKLCHTAEYVNSVTTNRELFTDHSDIGIYYVYLRRTD